MNIIDTDTWKPIEGSNDYEGSYLIGDAPKGARWVGFYVPRQKYGILRGEMYISRGKLKATKRLAKKLGLTLRYSHISKGPQGETVTPLEDFIF